MLQTIATYFSFNTKQSRVEKYFNRWQHGFRAKKFCETQLFSTIHDLTQKFEKGETIDVIILDFAKKFDTISQNLLFFKLDRYGMENFI